MSDSGGGIAFSVFSYYDSAMTQIQDQTYLSVYNSRADAPPIVSQIDVVHYNPDGSRANVLTTSPSSVQAAAFDSLYYYNKYFSSLAR